LRDEIRKLFINVELTIIYAAGDIFSYGRFKRSEYENGNSEEAEFVFSIK
jgi:hypothetical protein